MLLPSLVQGQFVSSVKLQPMIKYESSMHGFFYTGGIIMQVVQKLEVQFTKKSTSNTLHALSIHGIV